jgi:catechol-2,3-dioxygenase
VVVGPAILITLEQNLIVLDHYQAHYGIARQVVEETTLNHVAVGFTTREASLKQITFLRDRGVELRRRIDRGVTHSIHVTDPNGYEIELVYKLPRELWENDIEGALSCAVERPIDAG